MTPPLRLHLASEAETRALGDRLAAALPLQAVIHLRGDLGSGKTTLVRALVQALQPDARVKSPTYTLLESYTTPARVLHHLDLYRINDPLELEALGLRDLEGVLLIEWPERGAGAVPGADLQVSLAIDGGGRALEARAETPAGTALLRALDRVPASETD